MKPLTEYRLILVCMYATLCIQKIELLDNNVLRSLMLYKVKTDEYTDVNNSESLKICVR